MKSEDSKWRRAQLRHHIFFALVASILLSAAAAGFAVHFLGSGGVDLGGIRGFAAEQFALVWENPLERRRLVASTERHFPIQLTLLDAAGGRLESGNGISACSGRVENIAVTRNTRRLGSLQVCMRSHYIPHSLLLSIGSFVIVLWGMSGLLSRRIVRPLDELVRVVRDIGDGQLSARMRLSRHGNHGSYCARGHGEVAEVAFAVNQMAEKIERQIAGQRELLAAVSHEIRSPLARLRMLVELERELPEGEQRLASMEVELTEMDSLIGQLLAQSRLEFQSIERRTVVAAELARVALERACLPKELLDDQLPGSLISVDAGLFGRALLNLVENAKKHGHGLVALRVSGTKELVCFEVVDRGPGFDEASLKRAFEPFAGAGKERGLGLGLSLVKRIAQAHGATVDVRSVPQVGVTVALRISAQTDSGAATVN